MKIKRLIKNIVKGFKKQTLSISLMPSDDFDNQYSHSIEEINQKVSKLSQNKVSVFR